MNAFSTTLPTTDPSARLGLNSLRAGYSAMAIPIPAPAQMNSMSAVMTTALSLPANVAKSTGATTVAPSGTMLSMAAAEQRMNRTPAAMAFPLYDFIASSWYLHHGPLRSKACRDLWSAIGCWVGTVPQKDTPNESTLIRHDRTAA